MTPEDESPPSALEARSLEELPPTDAGKLAAMDIRQTTNPIPISDIESAWSTYFRYDSIYEDQRAAIESFLDTLATNGYYLNEGACGTGKTLAAVTASIHAMRDPEQLESRVAADAEFPSYDRTMVVTPVKQQLQQFISEMRGVNASLPDDVAPVSTIVLRGRSDMMAVKNADLPETETRDDIQSLRETTRELIRFRSDIPIKWPDKIDPPEYSLAGYDWSTASEDAQEADNTYQYDPHRAAAVRSLVTNLTPADSGIYDRLEIDGVKTPYPEHVPHTREVVDADKLGGSGAYQLPADVQGRFDPFYAATFAGLQGPLTRFEDAPNHVIDRQTIFTEAISQGRCPHEMMGILARQAEVILGNYNHLIDPETRNLTDGKLGLLTEETIAVVDEAHQLEAQSRDSLSASVDLYTLDAARNDVEIARQYATGNYSETPTPGLKQSDARAAREAARDELYLDAGGVGIEDLITVELLFDLAKAELIDAAEEIDGIRYGDSETQSRSSNSLASPGNPDWGDQLTNAIENHTEISTSALQTAEQVMSRVEDVYEALREDDIIDRTPQGKAVGSFFRQWAQTPREVYHPEAIITPSSKERFPDKYPEWVKHWTPALRLYNCIPQRELRRVFGELGSGVLMSATLRPTDPLAEATGIDAVPEADVVDERTDDGESTIRAQGISDDMIDDGDTRPTSFDRFPLRFPPENRLSLVVDLPRFTQTNRGSPYDDTDSPVVENDRMSETRAMYGDLIAQVASTEGNILIAMPNYEEAAWAHDYIQHLSIDKRCLADEASSADETDALLEDFFGGDDAILCTGLRGTITEGVDFDGEKLHTCLNIGVPLPPSDSRRDAVEFAYQQAIDSTSGRDAAQLIPSTRKVRQSIGRVIRGSEEVGVRIVADERYGTAARPSLRRLLSPQQQREFTLIKPADVGDAICRFWSEVA